MNELEAEAAQSGTLPSVPLFVFFGECVDVAKFVTKYWKTVRDANDKVVRPGLESVKKRLPEDTPVRIRKQLTEAQEAHTAYLFTTNHATGAELRERATFLHSELTAALEFFFDDGVRDDNDERLEKLSQLHGETGESFDALALALEDYSALAEPHRWDLHGLGEFDSGVIDEAKLVAGQLRELPPTPLQRTDAAKDALADRNAKLAALYSLVLNARASARYVFRNHTDIIREATSAYARRVRAERARAARRAADEEKKKEEATTKP